MALYSVVFMVALVLALMPFIFALVYRRIARDDMILQFDDGKIIVRKYTLEQLFRLKGEVVQSDGIVKIQTTRFPVQGTCISLFNQHNGALDFWVPDHLANSLVQKIAAQCPQASVVKY